ncbi:MAG: hypothetical protein J7623_29430 [Chitinophaga sp.]|uniref:hypothetical protein n=1 Tax=Chitinophaga sp. TaxID=1869181 RepID=UPI001B1B155C|nr:hypothetical protein [Chitinophaga sp.]MBO9732801.1 hypothetical protein [Chitinophaga sp.]
MASSFINFKGNGFWIKDNILNLTLIFLYAKMSEPELPSWAIEFENLIKKNAAGEFYGFVDLELDLFLTNDERTLLFIKLLDQTIEILSKVESDLRNTKLYDSVKNAFVLDGINIEAVRLIKVLEYLKGLVKGEIATNESDPIEYFF